MSTLHEDMEHFGSFLRMAIHFLHDRSNLKRMKVKEKKALVSMTYPFSEIVFAAGAIPVVPIRMHEFPNSQYLSAISSAGNLFGWNNTAKLVGIIRQFGAGRNLIKNIFHDVVSSLFAKYNEMVAIADAAGFAPDGCYGLRGLYGMFATKGKNLSLNLNFLYRCSAYVKFCEILNDFVPRSHYIDWPIFPPGQPSEANIQYMMQEIESTIAVLEDVTGNSVTEASLRDAARVSNECRQAYKEILLNIGKQDFWPCTPSTFSEVLTLLNVAFIDCCSNQTRFRDDLNAMVKEMRSNIEHGIGTDVSHYKKVVMQPIFGGYEPEVQEMVTELRGRVYYGEWYSFGFLNDISLDGNMVRNYAEHYLHISGCTGCSSVQMQDSFLDLVRAVDAEAVIYSMPFGCRDMTSCFRYYREKLTRELEIPVALVSFTRMGEGLEQVKTRVQALMEML
ncbi:MAG: hypothetical protein RBG13Loki_1117 [Promethearchaeota archaeon CR_4]|nr:MAG: hypothetical protein RBG13Loki_1117 [Candidatus Lokiarchaeota archaeon CR_4]